MLQIILEDGQAQESLSFLGGIPVISNFAHKKYPSEIRKEAAAFVRQMYQTSDLTLQIFIGCGGISVLVEFLEEDIDTERDLVLIGVNGVWSVFGLQVSPSQTPLYMPPLTYSGSIPAEKRLMPYFLPTLGLVSAFTGPKSCCQ